jgi:hypothetical protein
VEHEKQVHVRRAARLKLDQPVTGQDSFMLPEPVAKPVADNNPLLAADAGPNRERARQRATFDLRPIYRPQKRRVAGRRPFGPSGYGLTIPTRRRAPRGNTHGKTVVGNGDPTAHETARAKSKVG